MMHKKPSIVIPTHFEQGWNAYRLQEIGIACILTPRLLSKRRLLKALSKILIIDEEHFRKIDLHQNPLNSPKLSADMIARLFDTSTSPPHPG
jgi:UDP:flavonoid glycosyltransferase YjiC (YdhE family)